MSRLTKSPRPFASAASDGERDRNVLFGCFCKGARAGLSGDHFNPYRSEEHRDAGGYEPNARAWDRGHAWAVLRLEEKRTKGELCPPPQ